MSQIQAIKINPIVKTAKLKPDRQQTDPQQKSQKTPDLEDDETDQHIDEIV